MLNFRLPPALAAVFCTFCSSLTTAQETHHTFRYVNGYGSPKKLWTMAFSPDSQQLAVSVGGNIEFIDVSSGRVLRQHKSNSFSMGYTADGTKLYGISKSAAELVDTGTGATYATSYKTTPGYLGFALEEVNGRLLIKNIHPGGPLASVSAIGLDDELIGVAEGRDGAMKSTIGWSVEDAYKRIGGRAGSYVQLRILPRGSFAARSAVNHLLRRTPRKRIGSEYEYLHDFRSDTSENLVWCVKDDRHELRSAATGQPVAQIEPVSIQTIGQYALSPDNSKFAIVARDIRNKSSGLEVFDIETQTRLFHARLPKNSYLDVTFDASSSYVLVATWDSIEIADVENKRFEIRLDLGWTPPAPTPRRRNRTDEGAKLKGGGNITSIIGSVRDEVGGSGEFCERAVSKSAPHNLVSKLAVSSRKVIATAAEQGPVKLWDFAGKQIAALPKDAKQVSEIVFSPNGKWLAYHVDGMLHVVDVSFAKPLPQAFANESGQR